MKKFKAMSLLLSVVISTQSFAAPALKTVKIFFTEKVGAKNAVDAPADLISEDGVKRTVSRYSLDLTIDDAKHVTYIFRMDGKTKKVLSPVPASTLVALSEKRAKNWGWTYGTPLLMGAGASLVTYFVSNLGYMMSPTGEGNPKAVRNMVIAGVAVAVASFWLVYSPNQREIVTTLTSKEIMETDKPVIVDFNPITAAGLLEEEIEGLSDF